MGMGTVSWRRGSVCLMASIFWLLTSPLPSLSFTVSLRTTWFVPFCLQMCNSTVWSLSELGVKRSSLGMSTSVAHSVTHSPSCCIKRGCTVTKIALEIPLPPRSPTRPISKPQQPSFRTVSDKHALLVDLSLLRRRPTGGWLAVNAEPWRDWGSWRINNLQASGHAHVSWTGLTGRKRAHATKAHQK